MIKSRARALIKPMKHQVKSLAHDKKSPLVFDMSDPGCVSADTEFLTPTGWKRIDQYVKGDLVAQFHPDAQDIEFVQPIEYVKRPCPTMVAIAPARGMSQRLSHEHRVLYYRADGTHDVCSATEYMQALHRVGGSHLDRKFCTTFSVRGQSHIDRSDAELRLMVAVIADGHFGSVATPRCVIRLKKTRKILRLRQLLSQAAIPYAERTCGGDAPDFQVFSFNAPWQERQFGPTWWAASQHQLEVVADELPHWDSAVDKRGAGSIRFSTFIAETADFAQFAFAAAKKSASVSLSYRNRTEEGRGKMVEFVVHAADRQFVGPGRKSSVYEVPNPEGFKYCFEVPSTFLLLRHNGYIFATGNTGKTAVRIWAYAERRRKKQAGCLLVLAPRSLLRTAWANDFAKFAPDMKVSVATADNRADAFAADADVYITNHDAVKTLVKMKPAQLAKLTDLVVDEGTAYKHHTSQRSKAALKLSRLKHIKRKAILTATPTSNGICDIWHLVLLLDGGARLGPLFHAFRQSVCQPEQVGHHAHAIKWHDKPGAEEAVFGLISDITIRHKFEDCVDIPATHQYTVDYEMTPKQWKAYKTMELTQLLPLLDPKKPPLSAVNAAAVATKLLQIASGAVYTEAGKFQVIDLARYETIMDMASERKQPLIYFFWQHQRDALVAEAAKRDMRYCVLDGNATDAQRNAMVWQYQQGQFDVMFAHPASAAHGLTLTEGTSTIWSGPTYNLEWFKQGNKRQARIGQKHKTEVVICLAKGTIEEKVYNDILMPKDKRMGNLLDMFGSWQ